MYGRGALTLLVLVGCLPPAPGGGTEAPSASLNGLEPLYTQDGLRTEGAPSIRGVLDGTCAGAVLLEAGSPNQSRPLVALATSVGAYTLYVPRGAALELRWGCDTDGDGAVAPERVASATIGAVERDLPLDLHLADILRTDRLGFVTEGTSTLSSSWLRQEGARAQMGGAVAPPEAAGPADGAVGPPLPDGPPPGAGPPPANGSAPPL